MSCFMCIPRSAADAFAASNGDPNKYQICCCNSVTAYLNKMPGPPTPSLQYVVKGLRQLPAPASEPHYGKCAGACNSLANVILSLQVLSLGREKQLSAKFLHEPFPDPYSKLNSQWTSVSLDSQYDIIGEQRHSKINY